MSERKRTAVLRTIGIRLAVWGGVVLVVLLFMGDMRSIVLPRLPTPAVTTEPESLERCGPGWPHLRGPHYDGISDETGLADSWPPEGPPLLWMRELGQGYSGFSARGGRAYTQTQNLYTQSVVCLDGDTGRTIWEHRYGLAYDAASLYPGPRATPTLDGDKVYFAGPRGVVGCLRAGDGRKLWSVNVNEKFSGRGTDFGYSCSPLLEKGLVILPVGGEGASIVALDARDGSTLWASGDEPASYCSAIPITVDGRRHVVAFLQNALVSVDLESGRRLWQHEFSHGYDEHSAFPVYDEPYLMIMGPFRRGSDMYRIEIDETDSSGGEPGVSANRVWFSPHMSNDVASSVLVDGYVYGFDLRDIQSKAHRPSRGKFKCMELVSGDLQWETEETGHASLIAADGKLIMFNDTGHAVLARATSDRYEELARSEVFGGEICWTAPALDQGRLYLRTPTKAACLYVGKPEELEQERLETARPVSEIPKSRRMDFTWLLGGEREYIADRPNFKQLKLWYMFCLGVFAVAMTVAVLVYLPVRLAGPLAARHSSRVVFWLAALIGGIAATSVHNRLSEGYIFTWPAFLCVAHQITLIAVFWGNRLPKASKWWWVPVAAGLAFLAVCIGYFHVCRSLGLATEWVFLLGFLPSWPIALPAAYRLCGDRHPFEDFAWAVLSFSAYFWVCGCYMAWGMS